ncbi:hypothetical protein PIB30_012913 [Stylosanthes scabra]|uniref:Uncharacterized protein n=1 Tax=Stylosanthes scabra TaxID=79078 RepID=A0ABU6X833_9FABA|nr:hypothetical protein [Stylosanthes scabra]
MEVLSMFQRPRSVALEYEKPGTYGTGLIYPLYRLVECGFVGYVTTIPENAPIRIDVPAEQMTTETSTLQKHGSPVGPVVLMKPVSTDITGGVRSGSGRRERKERKDNN